MEESVLLFHLLKGAVTGIGNKAGQLFSDEIRAKFGRPILKKIENAHSIASKNYYTSDNNLEDVLSVFENNEHYHKLLYSFDIIDGLDLPEHYKGVSRLFLVELLKSPQLATLVFNFKIDEIAKGIISLKSGIKDVGADIRAVKDHFISSLQKYPQNQFLSKSLMDDFPDYYIPRSLVENSWSLKISSFENLLNFYAAQKESCQIIRALIVADGGLGKSVFLKHLAKSCLRNGSLYPVIVSLRDLTPANVIQDYIERRYPELKKISHLDYGQLVLFLDGFDEISDSTFALNQINDLCETYSSSHIVLTIRRNSYFDQFQKFKIFSLSEIGRDDIRFYIETVYKDFKIDVDHFFSEINNNNFSNLLCNPFYLTVLVEVYISEGRSLIIKKKCLVDKILEKRRVKDQEHRSDLELHKPITKHRVSILGNKIALLMSLLEKRNLSEAELVQLIKDEREFDLATHALPIKKGYQFDETQRWEFEHNIFLEHLVASVLKKLNTKEILELSESEKKIKLHWRDITSYLLGVLDAEVEKERVLYEELLAWLIINDAELLLNVEDCQISKDDRSRIFLQIYNWYNEKTLWIDSNRIKRRRMAEFGESADVISRLFKDIVNKENHYRHRINASMIFKYFKLEGYSEKVKGSMAEKYLCSFIKDTYTHSVDEEMLINNLIRNFPFKDRVFSDKLIDAFSDYSSVVVSGLVSVIKKNDMQDVYIDNLIEWRDKATDSGLSNYFSLKDLLNSCFIKMKKANSYVKYYSSIPDDFFYGLTSFEKDDLKAIIKNSVNYSDKTVIESVIELSSKYILSYNPEIWEVFEVYFQNERIREASFNYLMSKLRDKEDEKDEMRYFKYEFLLAKLIREDDLPVVFSTINSEDFYVLLCKNFPSDSFIHDRISNHLLEKYGHTIQNQYNPWPDRRKSEFDILFNKEQFKRECLAVFDDSKSNIINPKELWSTNYGGKFHINSTILSFLCWIDENSVQKSSVENWFEEQSEKLDLYLHSKICSYIPRLNSSEEMRELSEAQIRIIENYFSKWINETNLKITIVDKENSKYKGATLAPILIAYLHQFDFDCSDEKLCEMLGNPNADFNYIVKKIKDISVLKQVIVENLIDYKEFIDDRIVQMVEYTIGNKYESAYVPIMTIIKDVGFDNYHKLTIIERSVESGVLIENIIQVSSRLDQRQIISLCRLLIKNKIKREEISELLYAIVNEPEDDAYKLSALTLLIWSKDKKALEELIRYSIEHGELGLHDPFYNVHLRIDVPDDYLKYDDINVLPLLMELIRLGFEPNIKPETKSINNKIEENLIHLALMSKDNYAYVDLCLEQFIIDNRDKYEDVEVLNFTRERISRLFQEHITRKCTLEEALAICEEYKNSGNLSH